MKKIFHSPLIVLFILIQTLNLFGQEKESPDYFSFYPMHIGDKWFYRTSAYDMGPSSTVTYHFKEIIGDTLLSNGKNYFVVSEHNRIYYERIDSADYEIKWFSGYSCDANDVAIYTLKYYRDSSYTWYNCNDYAFKVSYFDSSEIINSPHIKLVNDSLVTSVVYFEKDLGIRLEKGGEIGNFQTDLVGALIKGVQWGTFTAIENSESIIPQTNILIENSPNSFNSKTQIQFELQKGSKIDLSVYSVTGGLIENILDGFYNAGMIKTSWDGTRQASGIYFIQLNIDDQKYFKKCVLAK